MQKFHRIYKATFEVGKSDLETKQFVAETVVTIQNPITLNLHIDIRIAGNQPNMGIFQFYNLSSDVQATLWKDYFTTTKRIHMTLEAGYGYPDTQKGNFYMTTIFSGEVQLCTSHKDSGSTEWLTEVQAWEGGHLYRNGYINETFAQGTKFADFLRYVTEGDKNTKVGYITDGIRPLPRNKTFIGQTMDILGREYGGYEVFIDKGKLNVLGDNEVIPGDLIVITDKSGLLGTPKRSQTWLELEMLFEPQLQIGQAVELLSDLIPQYNGVYKVTALRHDGVISERSSGRLITYVTMTNMAKADYTVLKQSKVENYEGKVTTQWVKPVSNGKITSPYGKRTHPISGKSNVLHTGIDIGADKNTPIYAAADGFVSFAGWKGGYGKAVQLFHGQINGKTVTSLYAHMNQFAVEQKQQVFKGKTILGYVGSTGNSTGPHLHFEVRENGATVNPTKYIGNF